MITNFVTSAIPAYIMQSTILPARIHNTLDKINRNFIWGFIEVKRKIHLVGWDKVISHKDEGGLGIKAVKQKNLTLKTRLCWRFKNCKGELWAETLKRKYLNRNHPHKHGFSRTWSAITKSEELCTKGSHWIIGNNSNLSFWYDKWTTFGPFRQLIQGPLTLAEENLMAKNTMVNGQWDCSQISFVIPNSWLLTLKAIPLRKASVCKDIFCWDGKAKGLFDSKHAYNLAFGEVGPTFSFDGRWIWKLKCYPKMHLFLWKCIHNSLPVKNILHHRGLTALALAACLGLGSMPMGCLGLRCMPMGGLPRPWLLHALALATACP